MDFYMEPEFAQKLIGKVTDKLLELNLYYLEPIAPYIEWLEFSSGFLEHRLHLLSLLKSSVNLC